jgi:glycosyltransferase involved in cell wall biosynthesis
MTKLSVALATFNEEKNISECLESVKDIADEIVIVDGSSTDKTVEIAKNFDAKVIVTDNPPIFHINKQKAIDMATGDWILQLDADERLTNELKKEIKKVISLSDGELQDYEDNLPNRSLFLRHQKLLDKRDGRIGEDGPFVAFFVPRLNYFLGKYLRYGGVYPDGVIRLFRKGKAHLPAKDVHEQMVVKGRVGWLHQPLLHVDSPTFNRYLRRNNRYVGLLAKQLRDEKVGRDPLTMINYLAVKPLSWFLLTQVRHKGILDGYQGVVFSFFSALRFPKAYLKYLKET